MASSKEVLNEWLTQGNYLDDNSVIDSLYNMKAPTDELAEQRFLGMYGNVAPFDKADRIEEPTIPSMDNIIGILGISDDPKEAKNPRTKEQKFIEDFPKKLNEWKKKIVKNPVYGELGWETVKDIWKQASNRKMLSDIANARKEAMDDAPLDFGLFQAPNIPGSSFVTRVLFPRSTEHLENVGDFTSKDLLADIAENAAMSIPGGAFTGFVGGRLAKVAPRVVNWASRPGSGVVSSTLKGATNMGGNLFGNAVVPFAAEGMDAALYGDNDEGMEHRADFSLGDALIGTAINQGVNRGLMRMAGPMIDRFSNGGLARGGTLKARQFLENLGQPFSKKGDDFANSVATRVGSPVANAGEITEDAIQAAHNGNVIDPAIAGITRDDMKKAIIDKAVLDAIDGGKIKLKDASQISDIGKKKLDDLEKKLDDPEKNLTENEGLLSAAVDEANILNGGGLPVKDIFEYPKSLNSVVEKSYKPGYSTAYINKDAIGENQISEALTRNPDAFINYAIWHGQEPSSATKLDRFGSYLNQGAPAWVVNKLGSEGDATMLLSPFPAIKKALDENRKEVHEAPKKRKMTRGAADILKAVSDGGELTEQDRKFLNAIAANPDILKFGYPEDSNAFNMWLLERGNQLLQGTSAFRPTFGVE